MSYLSRTLKYQYRVLHALETTAFTILTGLGLKKIVVFPEFKDTTDQALYYSKVLQEEIDSFKYKDIKSFDSTHTVDLEFSSVYHGKFRKKYNNQTKQQFVVLGKKWREKLELEHPDAQVWIVVHYDVEHSCWFLDTFNHDVTTNWDSKPEDTIWL